MNREQLMDAIGEIDDDIIAEAGKIRQEPIPVKMPKTKPLATAACFIAITSLTLVTAKFISDSRDIISPVGETEKTAAELKSPDGVIPEEIEGEALPENFDPYIGSTDKNTALGETAEESDGSVTGADETVSVIIPEAAPETAITESEIGTPETAPATGIETSGSAMPPSETAEPPTVQSSPTDILSKRNGEIILYYGTNLPDAPDNKVYGIVLHYENGGYVGENLMYTDNAAIRNVSDGIVFSFSFYQDVLDHTADMIGTLGRCVTVDYEGNTYDAIDYANRYISVKINDKPATLTEVKLGKGNGHIDYYFTVTASDGSVPSTDSLTSFTFKVTADENENESTTASYEPVDGTPTDPVDPLILPRFEPDGTNYFNHGHRTYTEWQSVSGVNDSIALFEVTDTSATYPDDPYKEYGGNITSGVYPIAGFNTDFALAAEIDGKYRTFIVMNGINLYTPSDLLYSLLHLDEKFIPTAYRLPNDAEPKSLTSDFASSDAYVKFADGLYASEFADPTKLFKTLVCELYFTSDDGMVLTLRLYELLGEYFVSVGNVDGIEDVLIKIDGTAFKSLTDNLK